MAADVEQNSEAIELAEFFCIAVTLPFIPQIVFVSAAVIAEHTKTVGVARSLRQGPADILIITFAVQQKTNREIMPASLRHSVPGEVMIVPCRII